MVHNVLEECGVCALWLSDGGITQEVIVSDYRMGKGEHYVCMLGEFDHRVAPV